MSRTISHAVETLGWMLSLAAGFALVANVSNAEETTNRLAQNRLAQNRLAQNRLAQNRLAQNALSSTRLEANEVTAELLATEDGREVYAYLMSCALPDGMIIEADVPGAPIPLRRIPCTRVRTGTASSLGPWGWPKTGSIITSTPPGRGGSVRACSPA